MAETSPATVRAGLTPERIIDTALELTRETHLSGWSIRDLSGRLGLGPSAVYHHVGGKDLLGRHVVERVLAGLEAPPAELDWQDWFPALLESVYRVVTPYPGVAKWMLMHGPTLPAVLPVLEAGMAKLQDAGFGDRAAFAYAALLNNAMLTVSMNDDRLQHEDDGPRDHATMMAEFGQIAAASTQMRGMGQDFIGRFAQGGQAAARMRWDYYRFVVDNTIAGLDAHLQAADADAPR